MVETCWGLAPVKFNQGMVLLFFWVNMSVLCEYAVGHKLSLCFI